MEGAPEVSVLLPIYRGAATLRDALTSTLAQAECRYELLALDDGSPDESAAIVRKVQADFPDCVQLLQHENRGLAATLNRGLELSRGRFIARQDQDDLMLPGRLAKQVAFLEANPDVAMVGTWAHIYEGDTPTNRYHRHPCGSSSLKLRLLFDNPFVHSSVMVRADALREVGGYSTDPERQPPEDYELWSRIARKCPVANLPEVLTVYREMPSSMSRTGESPFLGKVLKISAENLQFMLKGAYSYERCLALSGLYHNATAGLPRLGRREALSMTESAICAVSQGESGDEQFHLEADRLLQHISYRFLRRWLPGPVRRVGAYIRGALRN